ncbi:MFS transporter [Amnibacterium sp. CER49]|uniref:MFS transporter n=1 Tax=Amnibacterium sp. CER49 TaxID=3039161 RepID=UPI00244BDE4C|nr:MFS transporter [Amnibacterium sp. CER49]MDH2444059.1 MFS transporter [Amnibacterium sp. CER49]
MTTTDPWRAEPVVDAAAVQRRTLRVVVATQVLGGAGLAAGVTVGALLAAQLLGGAGYAGLPAAVLTLGSALTAYLVGRVAQRHGRRPALGAGFLAGGAGALGVVLAGALASPVLLLVSLLVYGAGTATNLQARYAGTDLAPPGRRGSAVSVALVSTTLGAVAGPNLVTPTGAVAVALGLPALVGPFLLAAIAYLAAGLVLTVFLRPDPLLLARRLHDRTGDTAPAVAAPGRIRGGVAAGAAVMLVGQLAMTAIMTMTPVHMRLHDESLGAVGLVIGLHIAAMYLPSLLTGALVDRFGRVPTAVACAVTLALAGLAAATLDASLGSTILALVLLGLGWNLGLIAGTAMVVDATTDADRARVQGGIDVLVALAGAGGSAASGVVMAASSYAVLSLVAGCLAVLLLPVLALHARTRGIDAA